jgi:ribose/xylose/arabinose/galactoside ABC-type transport system permease subunit
MAASTTRLPGRARAGALADRIVRQRGFSVAVLVVLLFGGLSSSQPNFLTRANIETLLSSASILWLISIGLTFVMLTGGLDLSLGSTLALTGIALGWFYDHAGLPSWAACLATIALGAVLGGAVNGVLIGWARLPFLVVTLGTLILFQGAVELWSGTRTEEVFSALLDKIAFGHFAGLQIAVWIMLGTLALALYVQRCTYFGRDVYALGSNPEAARLSGIHVVRTTVAVYAIAGLLAGVAGVVQVGRLGAASPLVGGTIIFDAAAAVLLGGTSIRGGAGGAGGTAFGVLLLATLQNGLEVSGVAPAWQQIIAGGILIVAIGVDLVSRQSRLRWRRTGGPATSEGPVESVGLV